MKTLITGGLGFLGRHFLKSLLALGNQVTVVDSLHRLGGGRPLSDPWYQRNGIKPQDFDFAQQDCRTYFHSNTPSFDRVIHLAGVVGGRKNIERSSLLHSENIEIDRSFFQWALRENPQSLVLFSSSAAYPVTLQSSLTSRPLAESDLRIQDLSGTPDKAYGWEKLSLEMLAHHFLQESPSHISLFRIFSGYGGDQSSDYPIPSLCTKALNLKNGDRLTVWGSGHQARDFVHVDDIVSAFFHLENKVPSGLPVNISTGVATSFFDLVELLSIITGKKFEVHSDPKLPEGPFFRHGDNSRLRSLGFVPSIDLKSGLTKVLRELEYDHPKN